MIKRIKNQKGFTLIELIAVIAILGTLALLVVPKIGNYGDEAKKSKANADITQLKNTLERYELEYGKFDTVTSPQYSTLTHITEFMDRAPGYIPATTTVAQIRSIDVTKTTVTGGAVTFKDSAGTQVLAIAKADFK